jgi:integrase/recombinase XerD
MEAFELFIKEKRYLQNVSKHTIAFYERSFKAFGLESFSNESLKVRVIELREAGMSAACVDAYIRGINPFLTWLYENVYTDEHLRVRRIKFEQKVIKTFTEAQVKAIVNFKPKDFYEKRLHTLLLFLADTGARVDEVLSLKRSGIDFDNILVTIRGKGNKDRVIPFSIECRKSLFRFVNSHKHEYAFPSRTGGKLGYNNMRRDFNALMDRLGIKVDGSFHAFRRLFATEFIRNRGNPFVLQRLLGHSTVAMTNKYVKLVTADLSAAHQSPLSRIK